MSNTSVLIVDSDTQFVNEAQSALEAHGVTVYVREDLPLDLVVRMQPDVLMLSAELPDGESGLSACGKVRRTRELRSTKVLLTGPATSSEAFERHRESKHAADDYALKPVEVANVLERIAQLLDQIDNAPPPLPSSTTIETAASLPPPLPSAGAKPPPLRRSVPPDGPPPLRRSKAPPPMPAGSDDQGEPATEEVSAPPPLQKSAGEGWKAQSYEELMRDNVPAPPPKSPLKGTPDQKMTFLRERARYLEQREGVAKKAWAEMQEVIRDFEHVATSLRKDLERRDVIISDLETELERIETELKAKTTEFETFQGEIEKIFADKDTEERDTLDALTQAQEQNAALEVEVVSAREQAEHDQKRVQILQEELDQLEAENQQLRETGGATSSQLDEAAAKLTALEEKLEMTSSVAEQRGEEIDLLLEKLDRLAIDASQEKERLIESFEERIRELEGSYGARIQELEAQAREGTAELQTQLAETTAQLEAQLEEQREAHFAELAEEQNQYAEQIRNLEAELAEARDQARHLAQTLEGNTGELESLSRTEETLRAKLEAARTEKAEVESALNNEIGELRAYMAQLEHQAEQAALERSEVEEQRDQLEAQLEYERANSAHAQEADRQERERLREQAEAAVQKLRETAEAEREELLSRVEAERQQLRADAEAQISAAEERGGLSESERQKLEKELESTRHAFQVKSDTLESVRAELEAKDGEIQGKLKEIEDELDEANERYFESAAENDHLRKVNQDLEAAKNELGNKQNDSEHLIAKLEGEIERLESERAQLGQERDRSASFVEEAENEISTLRSKAADAEKFQQMLEQERTRRSQLEAEVAAARAEAEEQKSAASSASAEKRVLETEIEKVRAQETKAKRKIASLEKKAASAASSAGAADELVAAQARIEELEDETAAQFAEVDELKRQRRELEASLQRAQVDVDQLQKRLEKAQHARMPTQNLGADGLPPRGGGSVTEQPESPAEETSHDIDHAEVLEHMRRMEKEAAVQAGFSGEDSSESVEAAFDLVMGLDGDVHVPSERPSGEPTADDAGQAPGMFGALMQEAHSSPPPPPAGQEASFFDGEATIGADSAIEDAFDSPYEPDGEATVSLSAKPAPAGAPGGAGASDRPAQKSAGRRGSVGPLSARAAKPSRGGGTKERKKLRALTDAQGNLDAAADALSGAGGPPPPPAASDPFTHPQSALPEFQGEEEGDLFTDDEDDRKVTEVLNLKDLGSDG